MTPAHRPLALVTGASSGIGSSWSPSWPPATMTSWSARRTEISGRWSMVTSLGRPLDALLLNAGVGVAGPFIETPLEDDLRLIALNVTSVVYTAKRLLPAMVERREGRVLVTASIASLMPGPWYATYAASKAFLLSFAEAVRYELKDTGVTVTALMPGPVDTEYFDRAGMQGTVADEGSKDDPADVARDGIEAMLAGDDHVVAHSWRDKLQAGLTKGAPESLKALTHAQLTTSS